MTQMADDLALVSTQSPLTVRSAVAALAQAVMDLESASVSVAPGRASLVQYWIAHLKADVKGLQLLAMVED